MAIVFSKHVPFDPDLGTVTLAFQNLYKDLCRLIASLSTSLLFPVGLSSKHSLYLEAGLPPNTFQMNRRPQPPCILEDRTGLHTASDFDDIYDRIFFRVAPVSERPGVVGVYRMNHRASRHRDSLPFQTKPLIILEFHPTNHALGNITFVHPSGNNVSTYMGHYLKKISFFGG